MMYAFHLNSETKSYLELIYGVEIEGNQEWSQPCQVTEMLSKKAYRVKMILLATFLSFLFIIYSTVMLSRRKYCDDQNLWFAVVWDSVRGRCVKLVIERVKPSWKAIGKRHFTWWNIILISKRCKNTIDLFYRIHL